MIHFLDPAMWVVMAAIAACLLWIKTGRSPFVQGIFVLVRAEALRIELLRSAAVAWRLLRRNYARTVTETQRAIFPAPEAKA